MLTSCPLWLPVLASLTVGFAQHYPHADVYSNLVGRTCNAFTVCEEPANVSLALRGTALRDTPAGISCCVYCSCDVRTCNETQNCCPGIEPDNSTVIKQKNKCIPVNMNMGPNQGNDSNSEAGDQGSVGVAMVSACPPGVVDDRCERPGSAILDENLPHTDPVTRIIYRNEYCASCNNVTSSVPWLPYVTCSDRHIVKSDTMMFPLTADKVFKFAATSDDSTCGVYFQKPRLQFIHLAHLCLVYLDQSTSDSCTAATCGKASGHNNTCQSVFSVPDYPYNDFVGLLNVGDNDTETSIPAWIPTDLTPPRFIPRNTKCNASYVYDPYMKHCRRWYCPNGRQLSGSACVPVYSHLVKAQIGIEIQLTPADDADQELFENFNKTDLVRAAVDAMFGRPVQKRVIIVGLKKNKSFLYAFVTIQVDDDDDLYRQLHDETTFNQEVAVATNGGALILKVTFASGVKIEMGTFYLTDIIIIDLNDYTSFVNTYRLDLEEIENVLKFSTISKMTFCSQILLERSEVRDYLDIIDIRVSDVRLRPGDFQNEKNSDTTGFRVCLSDYLSKADDHLLQEPKKTVYSPQAILSVVCNMLSMAGLLVTLITYFIFDELRSIPGKNNIMLALHLLIAQCLYQFGMDRTETPTVCIVLGVFIHLFWLTAIFWMNACTLHMFRTFVTGQSYRSVRALDPQVCCYMLYCYTVAVSMVAINMGVSLYKSNGKNYGYGGHVCYISDPVMVGWVFALPVGVIIILNMGFFFAVVYQISASTMRRRGKSTDRTNTVIYMKLSSLTGVTWIFGYLYMWTNFAPLEYIFIVLNAGQGVLIVISFICTKRILKLYWNLLRKHTRSCRTSLCMCMRKTPLSETNGIDVNTAKISLTASSRSKGLPMIGRFSQKDRRVLDKNKKIVLARNRSEGGRSSNSVNDSSDIFQDSMNIARCISNPAFDEAANKKVKNGRSEEHSSGISNGHSISDVQDATNYNIATVSLHNINMDVANK